MFFYYLVKRPSFFFFFFLPDVGFSYLLLRSQGCLPREVLAAANGQGQVPIFDRFVINSSAQVIEPGPESQRKHEVKEANGKCNHGAGQRSW